MYTIIANTDTQQLEIGYRGENLARRVNFDLREFQSEFGTGTWEIVHLRPNDRTSYTVTNTVTSDDSAIWIITDKDTEFMGDGQAELRYFVNSVLVRTHIWKTKILPSLAGTDYVNLASQTNDSPKFNKNTLCLYVGDTFNLKMNINLTRDGEAITLGSGDTLTFEFKDSQNKVVATKTFKNTDVTNNSIIFPWDSQFTAKFTVGEYKYRVRLNSDYVTTLVADNLIQVM